MANALSRWLRRASGRLYLFNKGAYTLHSGGSSMFKIDCDALTDADLAAVAQELYVRLPAFSRVVGVPTGGLRLALALDRYVVPDAGRLLVVDDVLTTGASITAHRRGDLCARRLAGVGYAAVRHRDVAPGRRC